SEKAKEAILYSYNKNINGFAAILDEDEAAEVAKHPNVISIFLSKNYELMTTRSWGFLGLERDGRFPMDSLWKKTLGDDIIIGNLDSGVCPESKSFSDEGFGPIPKKWRGICQVAKENPDKFYCATAHKSYPLINAADANLDNASHADALLCNNGTLDPHKANGKILVCLRGGSSSRVEKGVHASTVGAVGMILANNKDSKGEVMADPHVLPASHVNFTEGRYIFDYVTNTKSPMAYITKVETQLGVNRAPIMASLSSRGPNALDSEIL
ncbi:hypothetical protein TSUD_227410, partial [Trifolium subterraneum]